jgi:hypothetical protein
MRVPQYGEANLMGAFSQMQGSTASNPDFIGYQSSTKIINLA